MSTVQTRAPRSKETRLSDVSKVRIMHATQLLAAGLSVPEAADRMRVAPSILGTLKARYPDAWQQEAKRARAKTVWEPGPHRKPDLSSKRITAEPAACRGPGLPSEPVQAAIKQIVSMVAAGKTITEAAERLMLKPHAGHDYHQKYRRFWDAELEAAKAQFEALGIEVGPQPPEEIRQNIRKATALVAAGLNQSEIAQELQVEPRTVRHWEEYYPAIWQEELARAMESTLIVVRRQVGTEAILEDPAAYLRRAMACQKWAKASGRDLFPPSEALTLTTYFESRYRLARLQEASPATVDAYRRVLNRWRLVTGDPPLAEITQTTLIHFAECAKRMPGLKPGTWVSPNTIRRQLTHIEALLNKAGPPGYRNRDAAGIIPNPPFIKKPKATPKGVRIVTDEEFNAVYLAAVCMDLPKIPGFKPPAWWRALLVVARNTGLRRRALLNMEMAHVKWEEHRLDLPARILKSGKPFTLHLNPTAMEHLRKIRTDRPLVFPWPFDLTQFHLRFHRLQSEAGIPPSRHFGLHDIRKTLATMLWEKSPSAAQFALGHAHSEVTRAHYVQGFGIVARALDELPQPSAFLCGNAIDAGNPDEIRGLVSEGQAELARAREAERVAAHRAADIERHLTALGAILPACADTLLHAGLILEPGAAG
jgi:integrase